MGCPLHIVLIERLCNCLGGIKILDYSNEVLSFDRNMDCWYSGMNRIPVLQNYTFLLFSMEKHDIFVDIPLGNVADPLL